MSLSALLLNQLAALCFAGLSNSLRQVRLMEC